MRPPGCMHYVVGFVIFAQCGGLCRATTPSATPDIPALVLQGGHTSPLGGLAFAPSGNLLVTAGSDNRVLIWDVDSGLTLRAIAAPTLGIIAAVGVTTDSQFAIVASSSGVYEFDISTGVLKWTIHADAIFAAFSTEANRMAFYDGHKIQIVDTGSGHQIQEIPPNTQVPSALALRRMAKSSLLEAATIY